MNAKTLALAFVALAAAGAASAQEATPEYFLPQAVMSSVSRADVAQATLQARQAGQIVDGERSHVAPSQSLASRVQVQAETAEARRLGLIADGELTAMATPARLEQIRMTSKAAVASLATGR